MAFGIPGVPNLLKGAPKAAVGGLIAGAVSKLWNFLFPGPQWGIFDVEGKKAAIEVSSVSEFSIHKESVLSDYKIETGSFVSYNKVETPHQIGIRITQDGDDLAKNQLLAWLQGNVTKPTLFGIVIPEVRYIDMTLVGYTIVRNAQSGASMLIADCIFQRVRQQPAQYTGGNVASPENKPTVPTQRVNTIASGAGSGVQWR